MHPSSPGSKYRERYDGLLNGPQATALCSPPGSIPTNNNNNVQHTHSNIHSTDDDDLLYPSCITIIMICIHHISGGRGGEIPPPSPHIQQRFCRRCAVWFHGMIIIIVMIYVRVATTKTLSPPLPPVNRVYTMCWLCWSCILQTRERECFFSSSSRNTISLSLSLTYYYYLPNFKSVLFFYILVIRGCIIMAGVNGLKNNYR